MDLSQFEQIECDVQDVRFGTINIYMHLEDSENLIMEKYRRSASLEDHRFNSMQAEQRKKLQHECLLRLISTQHDEKNWVSRSFFEYPNEDLFDRREELRDPVEMVRFLRDTLSALRYMQERRFIHGDLRPEYIFYDHKRKRYILLDRLGDPSDSIEVQINNLLYEERQIYMSPLLFREVSEGNRQFKHRPFKSDTFSLGMVLISLFIEEQDYANCYNRMGRVFDYDHFGLLKDFVRETVFIGESESILSDFIFVCLANPNESQRLDPIKALGTLEKTIADLFVGDVKSSEALTDTVKSSEIRAGWGSVGRGSEELAGGRASLDVKVEDFAEVGLAGQFGGMEKRKSVMQLEEEEQNEERGEDINDQNQGNKKEEEEDEEKEKEEVENQNEEIRISEEQEGPKEKNQENQMSDNDSQEKIVHIDNFDPESPEISETKTEKESTNSNEIFESKVEIEDSQTMKTEQTPAKLSESQNPPKSDINQSTSPQKAEENQSNDPPSTLKEDSSLPISPQSKDSDYQLADTELDADSEIEEGFAKIRQENNKNGEACSVDETLYASVSRLDEKVNNLNDIYHQNIQNLHSFLLGNQKEENGSLGDGGSTFTDLRKGSLDMISRDGKGIQQKSLTKGLINELKKLQREETDSNFFQRIASQGQLSNTHSGQSKPRIFRGNSIDSLQKAEINGYKGPHDEYLIDIDQTALGKIMRQAEINNNSTKSGQGLLASLNGEERAIKKSGGDFNDGAVDEMNYFSYRARPVDEIPAVLSPKQLSPKNLKKQLERKRMEVNNARSLDFNNIEAEIGEEPVRRKERGFKMKMMTTGFSMSNPQFLRAVDSPEVRASGKDRVVVFKFLEVESRGSGELKSGSLDIGSGTLNSKSGRGSHQVTSLSHFSQSYKNSRGGELDDETSYGTGRKAKMQSMRAQTSLEENGRMGKIKRNSFQPGILEYQSKTDVSNPRSRTLEFDSKTDDSTFQKKIVPSQIPTHQDQVVEIEIAEVEESEKVVLQGIVENYIGALKSGVRFNLERKNTIEDNSSEKLSDQTEKSIQAQTGEIIVRDIVENYLDSLKANVTFNLKNLPFDDQDQAESYHSTELESPKEVESTHQISDHDQKEIDEITNKIKDLVLANESLFQTYDGTHCDEEDGEEYNTEINEWWLNRKATTNIDYLLHTISFNLWKNDGTHIIDWGSERSLYSNPESDKQDTFHHEVRAKADETPKKSLFVRAKSKLSEIGEEKHQDSDRIDTDHIKSSSPVLKKSNAVNSPLPINFSYDMTLSDLKNGNESENEVLVSEKVSSKPHQYETEKYSEADFITETKKSDFISSKNTSALHFSSTEKKKFTQSMELQNLESNRLRDSIKSETPRLRFKEPKSKEKSQEEVVVNLVGRDGPKRAQHLIVGIGERRMIDDRGTVGRLNIQEFATRGNGPGFAKIKDRDISREESKEDHEPEDFIAIEGIDDLGSLGQETVGVCDRSESLNTKTELINVTSIQSEGAESLKTGEFFESSGAIISREELARAQTMPNRVIQSSDNLIPENQNDFETKIIEKTDAFLKTENYETVDQIEIDEIEIIKDDLAEIEDRGKRLSQLSDSEDDQSVVNSYQNDGDELEIDIIDGLSDRNLELTVELEDLKSDSEKKWKVSKSTDGIATITEVTEDSKTKDYSDVYTVSHSGKKSSGENNKAEGLPVEQQVKPKSKRPSGISGLKHRFSEGQMPQIELGSLNFRKSPRISQKEAGKGFEYQIETRKENAGQTKSLINEGNNFWSNSGSLTTSGASSEVEGRKKSEGESNNNNKKDSVSKSAVQLEAIPSFGDDELQMKNIKEEDEDSDPATFEGKKSAQEELLEDMENMDTIGKVEGVQRESEALQETDESEVKIVIKYEEKKNISQSKLQIRKSENQNVSEPKSQKRKSEILHESQDQNQTSNRKKAKNYREEEDQLQESMARVKNLIEVSNFSNFEGRDSERSDFIKEEMQKEDETDSSDSDDNFVEDETGSGYYLNEKQLKELETANMYVCSEMQTRSKPFSIEEMEMKEIQQKKWERFYKKRQAQREADSEYVETGPGEIENDEMRQFRERFGNDFGDDEYSEEESRFREVTQSELVDPETESELGYDVPENESLYGMGGSYDEDTDESINLKEEGVVIPDSARMSKFAIKPSDFENEGDESDEENEDDEENVEIETDNQKNKENDDEKEKPETDSQNQEIQETNDTKPNSEQKINNTQTKKLKSTNLQNPDISPNNILQSEMIEQPEATQISSRISSQRKSLYTHKNKKSTDMNQPSTSFNHEEWEQPSPKSSYLTTGDITVSNEPLIDQAKEEDSMFQDTLQESGMLDSEIGRLKFIAGENPGKVTVREEYKGENQNSEEKLRRSDNLFVKKKGVKRVNVSVEDLGNLGEEGRQDIIEYSQSLTNNIVVEGVSRGVLEDHSESDRCVISPTKPKEGIQKLVRKEEQRNHNSFSNQENMIIQKSDIKEENESVDQLENENPQVPEINQEINENQTPDSSNSNLSKEQNQPENIEEIVPSMDNQVIENNMSNSDIEYASVQTQQKYAVNQADPQKRAAIKEQEALNRNPNQSHSRNQVVIVERNQTAAAQDKNSSNENLENHIQDEAENKVNRGSVQRKVTMKPKRRSKKSATGPKLFSNTAAHKRLRAKKKEIQKAQNAVQQPLTSRKIFESKLQKDKYTDSEVMLKKILIQTSSEPKYKSLVNGANTQKEKQPKRFSELREEEERTQALRQLEVSMDQRMTMNSSVHRGILSRGNSLQQKAGVQDSTIILNKEKLLSEAVDSRIAGLSLETRSRARSNITKRSVVTFVNAFDVDKMNDSIHLTQAEYKKGYNTQIAGDSKGMRARYKLDSVKVVDKKAVFGTKVTTSGIKVSMETPGRVKRRVVYRSVSPVWKRANLKSHQVTRPKDEYGIKNGVRSEIKSGVSNWKVLSRNKSYEINRESVKRNSNKKGTVVMVVRQSSPFRGRKREESVGSNLVQSKISGRVVKKPPPDFIKKNIEYVRALSQSQREIREKSQKRNISSKLNVSRSPSNKPQIISTSVKRKSYREIYLKKRAKKPPQVVRRYQTKLESTGNSGGTLKNKEEYKRKFGIKRKRGRQSGAKRQTNNMIERVNVQERGRTEKNKINMSSNKKKYTKEISRDRKSGVSEIDRISDNLNRSRSPIQNKKKIVPKKGRQRALKNTKVKGKLVFRKFGERRYGYK